MYLILSNQGELYLVIKNSETSVQMVFIKTLNH